MKQDNIVQQKSYAFAVRMVKLYQHLSAEKNEHVLSKQLLRCDFGNSDFGCRFLRL